MQYQRDLVKSLYHIKETEFKVFVVSKKSLFDTTKTLTNAYCRHSVYYDQSIESEIDKVVVVKNTVTSMARTPLEP